MNQSNPLCARRRRNEVMDFYRSDRFIAQSSNFHWISKKQVQHQACQIIGLLRFVSGNGFVTLMYSFISQNPQLMRPIRYLPCCFKGSQAASINSRSGFLGEKAFFNFVLQAFSRMRLQAIVVSLGDTCSTCTSSSSS